MALGAIDVLCWAVILRRCCRLACVFCRRQEIQPKAATIADTNCQNHAQEQVVQVLLGSCVQDLILDATNDCCMGVQLSVDMVAATRFYS